MAHGGPDGRSNLSGRDGPSGRRPTTRRQYLGAAGATVGAALLAGCTGSSNPATTDGTMDATTAATTAVSGPDDATDATTTDGDGAGGSYSVTMAPVGEVEFDAVPARWMSYFSTYGDMGVALGQADSLAGMYFSDNYPTAFYDDLGLDVGVADLPQLNADTADTEVFYELDADVHLMDPNMLVNWFDWSQADVDDVARNVGPFVGNMIRRHGDDWHDYRYYTLYEAFETIAAVFQERERYEAFRDLHDPLVEDLESRLPAPADRPEIGLLSVNSDFEKGSFWAYPIGESAGKKQYRDLGVHDAFADVGGGTGAVQLDYEALLEIDPDVLVFHFGVSHSTPEEFDGKMDAMRDDPVGSRLSAVQADRLVRGGTPYQGPIINLYQTELAAQQFYPDEFGDEPLFDRDRVVAIVDGTD